MAHPHGRIPRRPLTAAALAALFLTGTWLGAQGRGATQAPMAVTLTVSAKVDDRARAPVYGARVNVWRGRPALPSVTPPDYQGDTNSTGDLELTLRTRPGESFYVELTHESYRAESIQFTVDKDTAEVHVPVLFKPGSLNDRGENSAIRLNICAKDDEGTPVAGARLEVGSMTRGGEKSGTTGSDGCQVIPVSFLDSTRLVRADREGYDRGERRVAMTDRDMGKQLDVPITMRRRLGRTQVEILVTVTGGPAGEPVPDARIWLTGQRGITSGVYGVYTNTSGQASLVVNEFGKFSVEVTQDFYDTHRATVEIKHGTIRESLAFSLTEKPRAPAPRGDPVTVVVLAGDKGNQPLPGARVTVGGRSMNTDERGRVEIRTPLGDADSVTVVAEAAGYNRLTSALKVVRGVIYTDASASGTLIMQPGDAGADPAGRLNIIVEVRDGRSNLPLKDIGVDFYTLAGDWLYGAATNAQGERDFNSGLQMAGTFPVETLRAGLKLDLAGPGYEPRTNVVVDASLLRPSSTPSRFLVYLNKPGPDWTPLDTALAAIEKRIAAWQEQFKTITSQTTDLKRLGT